MGAVLGAVSPAVVVPRMVKLIETKYGTGKAIPQMILAGASCDDIFVIVLFTTFLGMAQGDKADVKSFLNIPVSIVLGVALGAVVGYLLYLFFEISIRQKTLCQKQHEGHHCTGCFLPADRDRRLAGRKDCHIRTSCSCQHGLRPSR